MTNYLWVVEILKCKEYVPYSSRKRWEDAKLVKVNAERTTTEKYRVSKYERVKKVRK